MIPALLFVTINDWPALSNLSGHSNKGYKACTYCLDDTDNIWLTHYKKVVFMGHRRFLPIRHPIRKKGNHFKGQADHRTKPMHRSGKDVFDVVKDLEVIFGRDLVANLFRTKTEWCPCGRRNLYFGSYHIGKS